jgi:arabinan endo-1,5-alpha-L-arabinosidase
LNARRILITCSLFVVAQLLCIPAAAIHLTGNLDVHDPSRIIKENGRYYTFGTGYPGVPIRMKYSDNLFTWQDGPSPFSSIPQWALDEVAVSPTNPNNMWAPDVIHFNNEYRLYYSVSTFGSKNSVIGLATNTTLNFNDPNYEWVDQQMVIESEVGQNPFYPYNAIDPGIFYDDDTERMWMTWGSFSNGIYVTELDPDTGKRITPNSQTINIARRAQGSAIEAPYLMKHDGYYYLFVNWDSCCNGTNSTYKIRVGRGTSPTGPFVDSAGVPMLSGGGDSFIATDGSVIGPGHFSDFTENGVNYFSYHFYNGANSGNPTYAIEEFVWTPDGWPVSKTNIPPGDYNFNGVVDAADYTVWRDTLGSTTDLRANGNNVRGSAGVIDQADYEFWKIQYANAHGGAGAANVYGMAESVPEPSSICLTAILAVALALRRRSCR